MLGPETAHSPNADDITTIYWVMFVVAGILILAINGALLMIVARHRAARGKTAAPAPALYRATPRVFAAFALLGIAIFAAVATPGGDLVSPFALGGTMYILFELTVVAIRRSGR